MAANLATGGRLAYILTMATAIAPAAHAHRAPHYAVAYWLLACATMVVVMVILGGATRLTGSGLSMVEWQPLNFLPPLTDGQWQAAFQDYRHSPQFTAQNGWMQLADFKSIFWLEYIHRLWGRLIGIVFFIPALWFVAKGAVDRRFAGRLGVLFVLGGLQGALGWYMVASGLESRPEVSHYRLAAHLISAFILYGFIVWTALDQFAAARPVRHSNNDPALARFALFIAGAVLVVAAAGAFVAGLHAGLVYNTFPLMDGGLLPPDGMSLAPWYMNFFENIATVQFDHRLLAITLVALVLGAWLYARRRPLTTRAQRLLIALTAMVLVQAALGISTLLLVVPVPLALAHQCGALVLFTLAIAFAHAVRAAPARAPASYPLQMKPAE